MSMRHRIMTVALSLSIMAISGVFAWLYWLNSEDTGIILYHEAGGVRYHLPGGEYSGYFDDGHHFSEGLAAVKRNERWGFIDENGRISVPLDFEEAREFSEGYAAVKRQGQWGYIDRSNSVVIEFRFLSAGRFSHSLAPVALPHGQLYIDTKGTVAIAGPFIDAYPFEDGVAKVAVEGAVKLYGFIDPKGHYIIAPQFDDAGSFQKGRCPVMKSGRWFLVDKTGKMVDR